MAIPDYQTLMLPVLKFSGSGAEVNVRDCVNYISDQFNLSQEERTERLPSGTSTYIANRVHWAKTYLIQAGLIEITKRSYFRITKEGKTALSKNPSKIDKSYLLQFTKFTDFLNRSKSKNETVKDVSHKNIINEPKDDSLKTPEEKIEEAHIEITEETKSNLLNLILVSTPDFFEYLILDLIIKMGYGGSHKDAAKKVGKTGDGGIDGIINEDRLGLDSVYLQAKRYQPDTTIGEADIRGFSGALIAKGATKGVFVTTCTFSKSAKDFVFNNRQQKIVLIDGAELTKLMVEFGIGVKTEKTIELKKIDTDYFDDFEN